MELHRNDPLTIAGRFIILEEAREAPQKQMSNQITKPHSHAQLLVYYQHLSNLTFNGKFFSIRLLLISLTFHFSVLRRLDVLPKWLLLLIE